MPDAMSQTAQSTADSSRPLAVIIMAAGKGTRMKSRRSKMLHEIAGRPLLGYAISMAEALDPSELLVVVGRDAEGVEQAFEGRARFILQAEQRGTGHAVQVAQRALVGFEGDVLIHNGDHAMLRTASVDRMRALRDRTQAPVVILTSRNPLPGVVIRTAKGDVERVVELTDATPEESEVEERNAGTYLVDAGFLAKALSELDDSNAQGEFYLTEIVAIARRMGSAVAAMLVADADETIGVNDRRELAQAAAIQYRRNAEALMAEGVTFDDPAATYIDTGVEIGRDSRLEPGVVITGPSRLGEGVHVKAHSVIEDSLLGDDVVVGPCAHLRPGSRLEQGVRIGNFVEVKNSHLGVGVKADHLAYVGDADVGAGSSFGCGSITVNYDWTDKHRTTVGEGVKVGCNANLVAPLELEDGAFVAAGTTVTKKVKSDAIAVSTGRQKNLEGWGARRRKKSGTGESGSGSDRG